MILHERYMRRALELASFGEGRVEPNPVVGAVVVRDGRIVGEGWHERYGGPHAEVIALGKAGDAARGAVLYVTLEPCDHHGKTPPCTGAILRSGIREVVAAVTDPNPITRGKGFRRLRQGGVLVRNGILAAEALRLNAPFFKVHTEGLPWVLAKWAMSLDGKIAARTGDSEWITSDESRSASRIIRGRGQAVIVGVGTILRDDPRLLAVTKTARHPVRVVLDRRARTPPGAKVVRTARDVSTYIFVDPSAPAARVAALRKKGCLVLPVPRVALRSVLRWLAGQGLHRVLIEGGGEVLGSAFDGGLVDEVAAFIAPKVIGGRDAKTPVEGFGLARVAKAFRLENPAVSRIGGDILVRGRVAR